jgi:menaquinone-specific isochorismate synthase
VNDRGRVGTVAEALRRLAHDDETAFVRLERPVDPFAWLEAATGLRKFFWQDREGASLAGLGVVAESSALDPSPFVADLGPEAFAFGGHSFDPSDPRPRGVEWRSFLPGRWVCPALVLETRGGAARLVRFGSLSTDSSRVAATRGGELRPSSPSEADWTTSIEDALEAIAGGELDKVVLARRWTRPSGDPWRLFPLLGARTGRALSFAFEAADGWVFFAASPERLFRRDKDLLITEAVAGTRQRTGIDAVDRAAADELLASDKDRREHAFVRTAIEAALRPLATSVEVGELEIGPAGPVLHLVQRITATLKKGVRDGDLLAALHPTPAVGGVPHDRALAVSREQEPFDRGWYAGPVGVASREWSEMAVGIRCALWNPAGLHAYAGAGVVAGSDPALEWLEILAKVSPWVQAPWLAAAPWRDASPMQEDT